MHKYSYQQLQTISMKLTTLNSNAHIKNTGLLNVFKLKKMIQTAANGTPEIHHAGNSKAILKDVSKTKINCTLGNSLNQQQLMIKSTKNMTHCHSVRSISSKISNKENTAKSLNAQEAAMYLKKPHKNFPSVNAIRSIRAESVAQGKAMQKSKSSHQIFNPNLKVLKRNAQIIRQQMHHKPSLSFQMFRLGRKVGRGRFGNIHLAQHIQLGLLVALKIMNKQQVKKAGMQQQLISEIKLQTYMKHPNILQMYGFFDDETNVYLMLELGEQSLFKVLRKTTSLPEKQTAYLIKQILGGLKYMHCENLIHRDLKPENILVVRNVMKIADFGWSVYSPELKRQTFCGTLDYVPPEIVKGEFYDESADVWSLGILIYELIVGKAPFEGKLTEQQTFKKIVDGIFDLPSHISSQLKQLIQMSLQKDPQKRLSLNQIEQSKWIKKFEREGRMISPEIWNFWAKSY